MRKPVILLSCHWDATTQVFSKPVLIMPRAYVYAVEHCGGIPLIMPFCDNEETLDHYVNMADGCILTGGYDIDPALYGEEVKYDTVYSTPLRDTQEEDLYKKWKATNKPVMGICRGLQFINVMEGGTLCQDIKAQHGEVHLTDRHSVTVEGKNILSETFEQSELAVNSYHHQCIERLADTLKVTARSKDDGIIEGIEHTSYPVFAVQYHPEHQCGTLRGEGLTCMEPLFAKFFEMCTK